MNKYVSMKGFYGDLFSDESDKKAASEILDALDGFSISKAESILKKCIDVLNAIPIKTK